MDRLFIISLLVCNAAASMRFASPLQAMTIWDNPTKKSPREMYLEQYEAGLEAEAKVREQCKQEQKEWISRQDREARDWARRAARYEKVSSRREEKRAEAAYDAAVKVVKENQESEAKSACYPRNRNEYQFVGVINPKKEADPIEWHARKKPEKANWSMRLVHVNRDAIIKDLFARGKVDVMAKYSNQGYAKDEDGNRLGMNVKGEYAVKERSWR